MSNVLKVYPWYSLLILGLINIFIITKSYDKKKLKFTIIMAFIMAIFPYLVYKLKLTNYLSMQYIGLTNYGENLLFINFSIIFIIEFVLYLLAFKLSDVIKEHKDSKILYVILMMIINIAIQVLLWFVMKYLVQYVLFKIPYNINDWYSLILMLLLSIVFVCLSFEKDEFIYAITLAIINIIYPQFCFNLGFKGFNKPNYSLSNIAISFIIQYVLTFIALKLSNRFTSGNSTRFIYLIAFIIISVCLEIALNYIISII